MPWHMFFDCLNNNYVSTMMDAIPDDWMWVYTTQEEWAELVDVVFGYGYV